MEVILMDKVINLGQLGDVIKVKDGYARNFLIPRGKAKRATRANIAEFEAKRADLEKTLEAALAAARERAAELDGLLVQVVRQAGVDGKLFGSVTNFDIVDALAAQGFEVEKSTIRMPAGPLKQVGDHPIAINLHPDVTVTITVSVLGES